MGWKAVEYVEYTALLLLIGVNFQSPVIKETFLFQQQ